VSVLNSLLEDVLKLNVNILRRDIGADVVNDLYVLL
jgi:hypothetical protein